MNEGQGAPVEMRNSQAARYSVRILWALNAQKLGSMVGNAYLAHSGASTETYPQTYPQNL